MSYDPDNISYKSDADQNAKRNAVRFLLDDKNESKERYKDSELDAWMVEWSSVWQAAAELADMEIGHGVSEEDIGSAVRVRYLRTMAPTWRSRALSHQAPIELNLNPERTSSGAYP